MAFLLTLWPTTGPLAAIAAHRPSDHGQLLGVPGIGPHKVAKYGEEMLRIIGSGGDPS